jgi:hypothetical protein
MSALKNIPLSIRRATVAEKGFTYETFRLDGRINGQRIRRQFKSRPEAEGEKNRLEVEAANADSGTKAINTRLTPAQLAQAEAAFARLAWKPIDQAVEWYLAKYRPSIRDGEIRKIANSPDVAKIIDLNLGVIRLQPEHTKTRFVRCTKIQPNLAAWLRAYRLTKFPLIPEGAERSVRAIRKSWSLGNDVARHTCASMLVAKFRSLAFASCQGGLVSKKYLSTGINVAGPMV